MEVSLLARPNKWDDLNIKDKLESITGWAKQGSTDKEICEMLGISTKLFYEWKKDKSEFREAIKKGKEVSNGELLNSAFMQSTGFYTTEQIPVKVKDYKVIEGQLRQIERVEVIEVEKYVPPNPTMNIFMLKNRLPQDYKDKREIETTGETTVNNNLKIDDSVKTEDIKDMIKKLEDK
jgi:gas vesicle protein